MCSQFHFRVLISLSSTTQPSILSGGVEQMKSKGMTKGTDGGDDGEDDDDDDDWYSKSKEETALVDKDRR